MLVEIRKPPVPLYTWPVGLDGTPAAEAGMETPTVFDPVAALVWIWPVPLYSVAKLLWLSAIQKGRPGEVARPQGFDRLASRVVVVATTPVLFETKALSVNPAVAIWLPLPPPPPHATTERAQATPTANEAAALTAIMKSRFMGTLDDAEMTLNGDQTVVQVALFPKSIHSFTG